MTRRAGGVSTIGLTSRFPSLVAAARDGAYEDAIHDLSMRSVPLKSTLTPANSRGPAEASPELAIFFTCSDVVTVTAWGAESKMLFGRLRSGNAESFQWNCWVTPPGSP